MPSLDFSRALDRPDLLSEPVRRGLEALPPGMAATVRVTPIDPSLADTAAFCEAYGVGMDEGANCIVVAGARGEVTTYAACLVLGTTRLDVNGIVRRFLGARRASFAPMDDAVALTGMEYGGITPIGLPDDWSILVDAKVAELPWAIVGAGIRGAKLSLPGAVLAALPGAEVIEGLGREVSAAS
ncbi:YbaK/EbsC family protein [Microbacterium sp. NPDC019599]|uniref:YbaK/EbsC family protein n=1 Tax=Microbacterium sp. NPDC019599 TaxID=3154690 RepID=UPI0033CEBD2A